MCPSPALASQSSKEAWLLRSRLVLLLQLVIWIETPKGDLHLCHLQRKWIHPCQLLASCWGHTHPLSDCKEQEVARLSGFNTFFPIWSGLALRAPPRTWWSWGWRTTTGAPTKTAPSFGTLKMENWLRFSLGLTLRRRSNCCAGGKDCEVHVWWVPQKGPGLASTKDSCKKGAEENSHET